MDGGDTELCWLAAAAASGYVTRACLSHYILCRILPGSCNYGPGGLRRVILGNGWSFLLNVELRFHAVF